jgi:hypothetical protein
MPVAVHPSGEEVPANLLRISLVFARPVGAPVLPRLALRRVEGTVIEKPFLEQELWSPSGKILTVLLHPGRVKSGLIAHEQAGPVLKSDVSVDLTLDGKPVKRWTVGADDHEGPNAAQWRVQAVRAGTRQALVVELNSPVEARDVDYIAVADSSSRRLPGVATLANAERRWTLVPAEAWRQGSYQIAVFSQLEDSAGNRLGGQFEEGALTPKAKVEDASIPFTVLPAKDGRR